MIIQEFNTFDAVMQHVGNQSLYSLLCFWYYAICRIFTLTNIHIKCTKYV